MSAHLDGTFINNFTNVPKPAKYSSISLKEIAMNVGWACSIVVKCRTQYLEVPGSNPKKVFFILLLFFSFKRYDQSHNPVFSVIVGNNITGCQDYDLES